MILSIMFLMLASVCNAVMDTVVYHFPTSIFDRIFKKKSYRRWWGEFECWRNKYIDGDFTKGRVRISLFGFKINKPVQICDAWHFFKMWMIVFIVLSIITYHPFMKINYFESENINIYSNFIIEMCVYGLVWNETFNIFNSRLLRIKK